MSHSEKDSNHWSDLLRMSRRKRLPIVRQVESTECGLACLAMVLGWHGKHTTLHELRSRFPSSTRGSTVAQIIRCADASGLVARAVRVDLHELSELSVPCILHWNFDHFVVLREVRKDAVLIHDPAVGSRSVRIQDVSRFFTGVAVEVGTGPNFVRKPSSPSLSLRRLAGSVQGIGAALRNIFAFAVVLEVVSLLMPQFLQVTVDQVLADGDHDLLTLVGLGLGFLVLVQVAVGAFRTWAVLWLSTHFTMNWTGNVFQHLMRLPQIYFLRRSLGDIVSRMGAITAIQQSLTTQFIGALLDGLMALATLVLLTLYSPLLSFIVVMGTAAYAGLRMAYYRTFQEANLSQIVVNAKQQSSLMEAVRGSETIRLHNYGAVRSARFLNHTADALNMQVEVQRLGLLFTAMSGLSAGLQRTAVLWLGAWLALKSHMTAGMLLAFASYADQFTNRSTAFADYVIQLRLLRLQGERLADIVLTPPEPSLHGTYQGPIPTGSIRFEGVSFRYSDQEPWVLRNCSFTIQEGEAVAFVGPSGGGKTTLLRLMLGLLDPQTGKIYVGEIEIAHLGKSRLRDMLGSVLQDDKLFGGSIADNICFFDANANHSDIEAAARLAEIHDDISAMPMGYHTAVGDMGSTLSGGQQQRIYLARALYRNPKILMLDEATSHLDLPRERKISGVLSELAMTRVIVAHRPETSAVADRAFVVSNGHVDELHRKVVGVEEVS